MLPNVSRAEWKWALSAAALIVALASLPYLIAWALTPDGFHYTGLLINPIDGNSYMAKMGQGAQGSWLFRLPYTAEPHEPVLIFTFHLLLGHLAFDGSPGMVLAVYHGARVVLGVVLLLGVYGAAAVFWDDVKQRRLALLLVGLTSGVGWLIGSAPDLTVPESVTFSSLMVNAHFGFTFFLMLILIVLITLGPRDWAAWLAVALSSIALVMIQPYAVVIVGLAAGGWMLVRLVREKYFSRLSAGRMALFVVCVLPFLFYFAWISSNHSQVERWMLQNLTPAPPWWHWLLAYGLLWPFAVIGAGRALNRRQPADWLLLSWGVGQLAAMVIPFALQRRMSTGLHLPLCFLAAIGLQEVVIPRLRVRWKRWLVPALLLLAFPSNLLMMAAGVSSVITKNPYVVLTDDQWKAMRWLRDNTPVGTVVLTDEELGTVVPAWGNGARVLYGHPFETPDAEMMRQEVDAFYHGDMSPGIQSDFIAYWGIQLVIVQEDRYQFQLPANCVETWRSGSVVIYRVVEL